MTWWVNDRGEYGVRRRGEIWGEVSVGDVGLGVLRVGVGMNHDVLVNCKIGSCKIGFSKISLL